MIPVRENKGSLIFKGPSIGFAEKPGSKTREEDEMKSLKAIFQYCRNQGLKTVSILFVISSMMGCTTTRTQDPGCGWINQEDVSNYASVFALSSRDGSISGGHIRSMNTWLQEVFEIGSCGGVYPERGVKAMDVFKRAYFKAGGTDEAWLKALLLRRSGPEEPNDRHYPSVIPIDYR